MQGIYNILINVTKVQAMIPAKINLNQIISTTNNCNYLKIKIPKEHVILILF